MFQCCHPHGTLKTSYIYVSDNFINARPNSIMGNPFKISMEYSHPEGFNNFL